MEGHLRLAVLRGDRFGAGLIVIGRRAAIWARPASPLQRRRRRALPQFLPLAFRISPPRGRRCIATPPRSTPGSSSRADVERRLRAVDHVGVVERLPVSDRAAGDQRQIDVAPVLPRQVLQRRPALQIASRSPVRRRAPAGRTPSTPARRRDRRRAACAFRALSRLQPQHRANRALASPRPPSAPWSMASRTRPSTKRTFSACSSTNCSRPLSLITVTRWRSAVAPPPSGLGSRSSVTATMRPTTARGPPTSTSAPCSAFEQLRRRLRGPSAERQRAKRLRQRLAARRDRGRRRRRGRRTRRGFSGRRRPDRAALSTRPSRRPRPRPRIQKPDAAARQQDALQREVRRLGAPAATSATAATP